MSTPSAAASLSTLSSETFRSGRSTEPTNIAEVEQLIFGKPASTAYPANLPLEMLKCIARDLRDCEVSMAAGVETTSFAAPFLLILHIVSGGSEGNTPPAAQRVGLRATQAVQGKTSGKLNLPAVLG
jgi:hypothetical protein